LGLQGACKSVAVAQWTQRANRTEGSVNTRVVFSGGTSVKEFEGNASTPSVEYVRGSDWGGGVGGILYTNRAGVLSFNHYNGRGDVAVKTDAQGYNSYQVWYEAFGSRPVYWYMGDEPKDRQQANTKEEDPTGLLNEGFRYRDLDTGTFITRDPAGFVDGPNLYTYVNQNPWSKFDPLGLYEGVGDNPWLDNMDKARDEGRPWAAMAWGLAGTVRALPAAISHTKSETDKGMAAARTQIDAKSDNGEYGAGTAVMARGLQAMGGFAAGTTSLVGDPVETVPQIPSSIAGQFKMLGEGVGEFSENPSLRSGFNITESAMNIALTAVALRSAAAPAPKGGNVFWSGGTQARAAAETFATQAGKQTLEMTAPGRVLDALTTDRTYPLLRPFWNMASKNFARGAGATTDVFQSTSRGVRIESVWATTEYPQLMKQGTEINYHSAP
jgi:RHS repeat-associated protein